MLKQAAAAAAFVNNPLIKPPVPTSAPAGSSTEADMLGNILKSNPALMLNPAAMLGLNPSLYAVQLAQLQLLAGGQAAAPGGATSSLEALRRLSDTDAASNLRKRKHEESDDPFTQAGLNLTAATKASAASPAASPRLTESPLDLSGSKKLESNAKIPKLASQGEDNKMPLSWPPFMHPLIAAGALTPEAISRLQMGLPPASSSASSSSNDENPLKRMNEIAKGTAPAAAAAAAAAATGPGSPNAASKLSPGGARPSAWQSQWLNRGPESNKDIFKCVWCKESYPSLQSLTIHMKETKHFGASIPASPQLPPSPASTMSRPSMTSCQPTTSLRSPTPTSVSSAAAAAASAKNRDILKEQLPMPRKLVRGQDVWLGRGEQQTRDILKCMWCGESFRSLDLMTKHMQETKHYTKVISQVI